MPVGGGLLNLFQLGGSVAGSLDLSNALEFARKACSGQPPRFKLNGSKTLTSVIEHGRDTTPFALFISQKRKECKSAASNVRSTRASRPKAPHPELRAWEGVASGHRDVRSSADFVRVSPPSRNRDAQPGHDELKVRPCLALLTRAPQQVGRMVGR